MQIGGHGNLIAFVAPGISIQSLTQSLCLGTQLYIFNVVESKDFVDTK